MAVYARNAGSVSEIVDAYARHNNTVKPVQEIWARRANNSVEKIWPVAQIVSGMYTFSATPQSGQVGDPVECTVIFGTNGAIVFSGTGSGSPPNWYEPITPGIGNSYYIRWQVSQATGVQITTTMSNPSFWYPLSSPKSITFRATNPTQVTGNFFIANNPQGNNSVQISLLGLLETFE